jgi:hypothetical protein
VIHKEGIGIGEAAIKAMLEPELANWEAMKSRLLLRQMEKAAQAGRLVCGIHEVRKAAGCRNSRLVIVESREPGGDHPDFYSDGEIDGLIVKVLENGGTIEKMDKELLEPYGPVAVIKYY